MITLKHWDTSHFKQSQHGGGDSFKPVSLTISPLPWQSWSQGPPSSWPLPKPSSPPLIAILLTDKWRWLQTGSGHESLTPWHQLMKNASALSESLILIWLARQVVNVKWISRKRWRGSVRRAPQYNRSLGKPDPRIEPKGRKKQIRSNNVYCVCYECRKKGFLSNCFPLRNIYLGTMH